MNLVNENLIKLATFDCAKEYETAVHEAAHVAADYFNPHIRVVHGYQWKQLMWVMGLEATRCHTYDTVALGLPSVVRGVVRLTVSVVSLSTSAPSLRSVFLVVIMRESIYIRVVVSGDSVQVVRQGLLKTR